MGAVSSKVSNAVVNDIYREQIVNILSKNSTSISNVVNNAQNMRINVNCAGGIEGACSTDQTIVSNLKVTTAIAQQSAVDLQRMFENDISNKNSQIMKIITELLSDAGTYKRSELSNEFVTRLKDIVREDITQENLVSILNMANLSQNLEINLKSEGKCIFPAGCTYSQNIAMELVSDNIITNLISTVTKDSSINRIVNDNSQEYEYTSKGINDLAKTIASSIGGGLLVMAIVIVILANTGAKILPTAALTEVAKQKPYLVVAVVLTIVVAVYSLIAWFFKLWPFNQPKELWQCEKINGKHTGKCVAKEYKSEGSSGYLSKEECEKSKSCDQYWGCGFDAEGMYNGQCNEYDNPISGPARTKEQCETELRSGKSCVQKYECAQKDGLYEEPARCVKTKNPSAKATSPESCATYCRNKWKCLKGSCSKAQVGSEWGMFDSEADCNSLCKK